MSIRATLVILGAVALTGCAASLPVPDPGFASNQQESNATLISAGAGDAIGKIMMPQAAHPTMPHMEASAAPVH
jgi:hypothetical protein